jgi:hypothetical protein
LIYNELTYEDELKKLNEVLGKQFSEDFINKMKARVFFGFYRYGESKQYKKDSPYNIMDTILKRLEKYRETGNQEHLVDAVNFIMIEYMHPQHPNAHFESIEEEDVSKRLGVVRSKEDAEVIVKLDNELKSDLKGNKINV